MSIESVRFTMSLKRRRELVGTASTEFLGKTGTHMYSHELNISLYEYNSYLYVYTVEQAVGVFATLLTVYLPLEKCLLKNIFNSVFATSL